MPWTTIKIIHQFMNQYNETKSLVLDWQVNSFEYLFLASIFIIRGVTYSHSYDSGKNFKISDQKYYQEKNSIKISFVEEGWKEFKRRITQSHQLITYKKPTVENNLKYDCWVNILKPSWEDRAKQLLELSRKGSYTFDEIYGINSVKN